MKKKEKIQEIKFKNLSGISGQYVNNAQGNFMDKILQGCADVNRKEQEGEKRRWKQEEKNQFLSETLEDLKEFQKYQQLKQKYEAVGAGDGVSSVEGVSPAIEDM